MHAAEDTSKAEDSPLAGDANENALRKEVREGQRDCMKATLICRHIGANLRGRLHWHYKEFKPKSVVIHTGKLQPVLIRREKPVLLALLSNLGIPVPASYPVFRTKWREIS